MNLADRQLLAVPNRQAPVAVVFLILKALRNLGVVNLGIAALFLFNLRTASIFLLLAPLVIIAGLAVSALAWWRFTFLVVDDELVVTKGIANVQRLVIPLDRVQSVSIEQDFLHRPLQVVRASVDTAGTSAAEFEIHAIGRPVAEALQRLAAEHIEVATAETVGDGAPPPAPPMPDRVLLQRTPAELVKVGLAQSPWAGLAVLGPLFLFVEEIVGAVGFDLGDRLPGEDFEFGLWILWLAVGLLVLATLLSLVLQVGRSVVTDWDLTLSRTSTGLRRTSGLLARRSRASSLERIQRLEHRQSPVQRWAGIHTVNLVTIGDGDINLPGSNSTDIATLRAVVLESDAHAATLDRVISPEGIIPPVRNGSILIVLLILGLIFSPIGLWSLLLLLLPPVLFLLVRRANHLHRWSINGAGMAQRHQLFTRRVEEIALRRAQRVDVRQSFFQRRRGLASVTIDMADGSVGIPMISVAEAFAVRDAALACAETDPRPWM